MRKISPIGQMFNKNCLKFPKTAQEISERAEQLIKNSKNFYDELVKIPRPSVDPKEILRSLNAESFQFSIESQPLEFLQNVSADENLRNASTAANKILSEFGVELSMRSDVFNFVNLVQDVVNENEKFQKVLTEQEKKLLKNLIKAGRRNGLHLQDQKRDEIEKIKKKISELSIEFSKNLAEEKTKLFFEGTAFEGMESDFVESLEKAENGKLVVTLKYPHVVPILETCKNRETRRQVSVAFNSRCAADNMQILEELVKLRQKKAEILGFDDHSAFITEDRMAKTNENVSNFLLSLKKNVQPLAERDWALLLKYFEKDHPGEVFQSYDLSFYRNLVEDREFSVDSQEIMKFFPMEHVTEKLLEIYQRILDLNFVRDESQPVWHEEVVAYRCEDRETGKIIGWFYLDLFPREGKFGHAAVFPLQPSCLTGQADGERSPAACSLVCNFPRKTNDKPALLRHDDVVTFFHEFGHAMHFICAQKADLCDLSGFNVEHDFVECPSQMLENWCWDEKVLKELSAHYETKEPLPDDLIERLVKSKNANGGVNTLRQLTFAIFDYQLHSSEKNGGKSTEAGLDINGLYSQLSEEVMRIKPTEGTFFPATFGHLCGYDAQYYGYLWSEVFSCDMFWNNFRGNVFDKEEGLRYREMVLGPGGSKDGVDIIKDYLGREANQDAFLKMKGVKTESDKNVEEL